MYRAKHCAVLCGDHHVTLEGLQGLILGWKNYRITHAETPRPMDIHFHDMHFQAPTVEDILFEEGVKLGRPMELDIRHHPWKVLCSGRQMKASDPRDKFFALVPLLQSSADVLASQLVLIPNTKKHIWTTMSEIRRKRLSLKRNSSTSDELSSEDPRFTQPHEKNWC